MDDQSVKRQREVDKVMVLIEKELAAVEHCFGELDKRLQPVVNPQPKEQSPDSASSAPPLCSLAEGLNQFAMRLTSLSKRLGELNEDIQL